VLIATRAGEIERDSILNELNGLLSDKPENASDGLVNYLEFLIAITKGEETESRFEKLDQNLKELFGNVMQKFKGNDIMKNLKEITRKSIVASKGDNDNRETIITELTSILSEKPEDGSKEITKYIEFLIEMVKGNNIEEMASGLDSNLLEIFNNELGETMKPDMMKFFSGLAESAFKSAGSEDDTEQVRSRLMEMLSEKSNPPVVIADYLKLLLSVVNGEYREEMREGIAPEFLKIFDEQKKQSV